MSEWRIVENRIFAGTQKICEICHNPQSRQNARLIAAAPDLLEVCKAIAAESQAGLRWSANNITALNAAIAKARL